MIKITRTSEPATLVTEAAQLLLEYNLTKSSVWNKPYIREALMLMSHGKCCYCETKINEESKYLEVEHFKNKDTYPNEVVTWVNLLPSCKRCNVSKGVHDVIAEPIIDPTVMLPADHLLFSEYRLGPVTVIGKNTIEVLCLNDTDRVVLKRFKVGERVKTELEHTLEILQLYLSNFRTQTKNRVLNSLKGLLREAGPEAEYSATVATILLNDDNFLSMKETLQSHTLWDAELVSLVTLAETSVLNKK